VSKESEDEVTATLPQLVAERATRIPDHPALIDSSTGAEISYATLASQIDAVTAGLAASGLGRGDVLAVWAPNVPQWLGVALGAMAAGGAVTGVSPLAADRELSGQLVDSGASVLVTVPELEERARAAAPEALRVKTPSALLDGGAAPEAPDPEGLALLPYSSGTTGLPKGVMLTHGNLVASVGQLGSRLRLSERDVVLAVAPFSHIMGFTVTGVLPLCSGATLITMPRFDAGRLLDLVEEHRVTVLAVPPPVMAALAAAPPERDLSSVELVVCGGAPLSAERHAAVAARLPQAAVGQGYGLTETAVGITGPDRDTGTVPGSVGRALPDTELRVVDGELWVRGPQNTPGYLGRPDATAALIDHDGWLHTGDLGRIDADGNVWIVDRLKELIKVNGHQVAPAELEGLLAAHPLIADAAVVGRPDPERGEIPVAIVVARGDVEADALTAWIAERVAPYKRIRDVRFVDAIPRTPAGKMLRRLLRVTA
jgi:acyl-CoA synthetase (AMP-forming)/AMP-acid ligase II